MFDFVVIGTGPGGYVSAIRAAQLGLKVAVVEKEHIGGTCLNKGCIPTKAMLQSAKVHHFASSSAEFGVLSGDISINFDKIIERTKGIVSGLGKGVAGLFAKNNIKVFEGTASFKNNNTILIKGPSGVSEISSKNIVIATGARPRMIPNIPQDLLDKKIVWTSKNAISPPFFPKKLLVIGSGAIGIEFASFYRELGAEVVVAEIQDRILVLEDDEISSTALKLLSKKGISFKLKTKSQNFKEEAGKLIVDLQEGENPAETMLFDACIVAIGVVPNIDSLELENAGIFPKENGMIETFEYQKTSQPGIYAIGDICSAPWLAHKASREGIIVAEKCAGIADILPIDLSLIPSCVYSNPQIASIGMTQKSAIEQNIPIRVGKSHFRGNGKALASGESDGFVKVLFEEKTGELLGAHMIGYEVSELISMFSLAISAELTEKELLAAVFPHPTMSEVCQEAVANAFDMAIHG